MSGPVDLYFLGEMVGIGADVLGVLGFLVIAVLISRAASARESEGLKTVAMAVFTWAVTTFLGSFVLVAASLAEGPLSMTLGFDLPLHNIVRAAGQVLGVVVMVWGAVGVLRFIDELPTKE